LLVGVIQLIELVVVQSELLACAWICKEWSLASAVEVETALRIALRGTRVQPGAVLCTDISGRRSAGCAGTYARAR
jgi:hypothetical protein